MAKSDWDLAGGAFTTTPIEDSFFTKPAPEVKTAVTGSATLDDVTPQNLAVTSITGFDPSGAHVVFEKALETDRTAKYTAAAAGNLQNLLITDGLGSFSVDSTWNVRVRNCVVQLNASGYWRYLPSLGKPVVALETLVQPQAVGTIAAGQYEQFCAGLVHRAYGNAYYGAFVTKIDNPYTFIVMLAKFIEPGPGVLLAVSSPVDSVGHSGTAGFSLSFAINYNSLSAQISGTGLEAAAGCSAVDADLYSNLALATAGVGALDNDFGTILGASATAGGSWYLDRFRYEEGV